MPKERKFNGQSGNKNNNSGRKDQPRGGLYNQRGGNPKSEKKIGSNNLIRDPEPMREYKQKPISHANSNSSGALQTTIKRVILPKP